ncbi:MAG TPA: PQQ-binding-like beta-propeller repeat protein [Candidatus Polarisedimenticolaceae bacterium]|nr:PQQ-binding-like beta-propeller repeat protein [Candidatus Polarisedimenticolaceae bacterium]
MSHVLLLVFVTGILASDWPQWGGPQRDFTAAEAGIELSAFPTPGPRVVWDKPLGPGYAAIVTHGDRLVTAYRRGQFDVVVCLDRERGDTRWEHAYEAPVPRDGVDLDTSYGEGPNSTPLLADGRVYTLGLTGVVHALDLDDGTVAWSHDLRREYEVPIPYFGHAASPVRHGDSVIFIAGGALAFDLETGELRWHNRSFGASYASPLIVDGEHGAVLVAAVAGEIVGLDPSDGALLWRHEHANQHRTILSSPILGADGRLFVSAYWVGSLGLVLGADGRSAAEAWRAPQVQLARTNAVRVGDWIFGFHRSVLSAVNAVTGEIGWRHRGLRQGNLVRLGGDRFLLLDAIGNLTLASLTPEGAVVHDETQLFHGRAWTVPTIVGTTLYARDLERIVAVDLRGTAETPSVARTEPAPGRAELAEPAFREAIAGLARAARREDAAGLAAARGAFAAWRDRAGVAHLAHYYLAFAAWRQAVGASDTQALAAVDAAVEHLGEAIRLRKEFADAHALLATLYAMYYRLDPQRAAVIGPLADEHLDLALLFGGDHPRVVLTDGLRRIDRPVEYGGDRRAGLARVREALELFERESTDESGIEPGWCHGLAWSWYGEALMRGTEEEREPARRAFERALEIDADLATARRMLAELTEQAPGGQR